MSTRPGNSLIGRFVLKKINILFIFFRFWAKKSDLEQKHSGRVGKTALYVSRGTIRTNFFSREIIYWTLSGKITKIEWKNVGRPVKPAKYMSRGTIWTKYFFKKNFKLKNFWNLNHNFSELWVKKFQHIRQICNLGVHENNLRRFFGKIINW